MTSPDKFFKEKIMRHRHRYRPHSASDTSFPLPDIARLWLLRALVPLGRCKKWLHEQDQDELSSTAVATVIGLSPWLVSLSEEDNATDYVKQAQRFVSQAKKEIFRLHQESEQELRHARVSASLAHNVSRLAERIGLSATECRILEFFAEVYNNENTLGETGDILGECSTASMHHILSVLLDIPETEIRAALSDHGALVRSGLLRIEESSTSLTRKIDWGSRHFPAKIYTADVEPLNLLRDMFLQTSPASLQLTDFDHLVNYLDILRPYLAQVLASQKKGVHIFLHGAPGTGKSELARILAQTLGCELFEVSSEDEDGDSINGERRLRAFRTAQYFLGEKNMLLFDEAEDVFSGSFFQPSIAQCRKGWMNRILEESKIPTLWVSNSIQGIDPAFLRRFDMVFELPVPPKKQRQHILQEAASGLLQSDDIQKLAEAQTLAPAVVSRTAAVLQSVQAELGQEKTRESFWLMVNSTLEIQQHRPIRKNDPNRLPETYNPAFVQTDVNLVRLAEKVQQSQAGRFCFYGPPGSGKTAYGRWLAEKLDKPLLVKRASDLLSMWVGKTEQNIARAFAEAERENAVLQIDEMDSFLQDRRTVHHSWEMTQTNEMLTQMEAFSGIFIATTNLMNHLDQAALRRFDLKVKFDFLPPEKVWNLLPDYCQQLALPHPDDDLWCKIACLKNLTLGDFATVMRQQRFRVFSNPAELVAALEAECAVKEGAA
jgi:AAA+ superfamily predicted ATPase